MIKKDSPLEIRAEHLKKLTFIYLRQSNAIPNVVGAEVKSSEKESASDDRKKQLGFKGKRKRQRRRALRGLTEWFRKTTR
jgi:hypothetical protein